MATRLGTTLVGAGLTALSCVCVLAISRELLAARFVPAEIRIDGKTVLKGNASDDGERDADELWRSLSKVQFQLTTDGEKWAADADPERRVLKGEVSVRVKYGGVAEMKELNVLRTPQIDGTVVWMIDPADVKKTFLLRCIPRLSVGSLKDIKAKE